MQTQDKPISQTSEFIHLHSTNSPTQPPSIVSIQDWLVNYVADLLEVASETVDPAIPFDRYGLDSAVAIGMTGDLEDFLGCEIDPTALYDYPTIQKLSEYLAIATSGSSLGSH